LEGYAVEDEVPEDLGEGQVDDALVEERSRDERADHLEDLQLFLGLLGADRFRVDWSWEEGVVVSCAPETELFVVQLVYDELVVR
jgi:hypothetical protein